MGGGGGLGLLSSGGAGDDGSSANSDDVAIFSCEVSQQSEEGLVRNVLKRARGLMLPGALRCFGTAEHNGQIFLAMEKCVPLKTLLQQRAENRFYKISAEESDNDDEESSSPGAAAVGKTSQEEKFQVAVAFGMNTISNALSSLHRNKILHGSVCIDSVFVLEESGAWRLFGFDYVSNFDDVVSNSTSFNRSASRALLPHRLAPEATSALSISTLPLLDSWGLGILLYETFHFHHQAASSASSSSSPKSATLPASSSSVDLRSPKIIPRDFLSSYTVLVAPTAKLRWTPERFHKEAEMIHGGAKIVRLMTDLENLTLKDSAERDTYYRELATCVHACPVKLATGMILPKISSLLQYGGCSAAALVPLLKIARKLSTEAFAARVAPSVLVMFSSNEPLVRMKLLEHAEMYAPLLPEKLVSEKIWPLYLQGLTSKIPEIRELSIRALIHFAPVLTERFTSGDVVKALLALQQDSQGAIRTNTTICLGMLARFLPSESRAKTLCSGFGRMLKDPYAPSRAAAVKSIASLSEETFTAQMVCEQLLPALCPLLLDSDRVTRDAATNAVQTLVKQGISAADAAVPCAAPQPALMMMVQHQQQQQQQARGPPPPPPLSAASTSGQNQPKQQFPNNTRHASTSSSLTTNVPFTGIASISGNSSVTSTPVTSSSSSSSWSSSQQTKTIATASTFPAAASSSSSAVVPGGSSLLDITPMKERQRQPAVKNAPATSITSAKKSVPALIAKGWDNDFVDSDDDQVGGGGGNKNNQKSDSDDEWSKQEFSVAPAKTAAVVSSTPKPVANSQITASKLPVEETKQHADPLGDTFTTGGAAKLGASTSGVAAPKKRGFGIKS